MPARLSLNPLTFESLDDALLVSATLSSDDAALLTGLARSAFDTGFVAVLAVLAALLLIAALRVRPGRQAAVMPRA
jgi:DHA2 family multidrug resistance protein-like MFS transporter